MHVRKQIRDAVISVLKTEFGDDHIGDAVRLSRSFQKRNLPFIAVAVSESVDPTNQSFPGQREDKREFTIAFRTCVDDDDANALDSLDALNLQMEQLLFDGSILDLPLHDWRFNGTSDADLQPLDEGTLIANTSTYSAFALISDADPTFKNL